MWKDKEEQTWRMKIEHWRNSHSTRSYLDILGQEFTRLEQSIHQNRMKDISSCMKLKEDPEIQNWVRRENETRVKKETRTDLQNLDAKRLTETMVEQIVLL